MNLDYKNIIFDLGNVVFSCSFEHTYAYWSKVLGEDVRKPELIFDSTLVEFEKGNLAAGEFYDHINRKLGNALSYHDFTRGWNLIYEELIPGAEELLKRLSGRYRLFALTNTNGIHYDVWTQKYREVLKLFIKVYSSHIIRLRKPDRRIYEYVLNENKLRTDETIFLDDTKENVDGAADLGIKSLLVSDFTNMVANLNRCGINTT